MHIFVTNLPVYATIIPKSGEDVQRFPGGDRRPLRHRRIGRHPPAGLPARFVSSLGFSLSVHCTSYVRMSIGAVLMRIQEVVHMTRKPCPRCGKLIPCGMAYCEDCTQIRSVRRQTRRADSADGKQYRAFYRSAAWKRTSLAKLSAVSYQCEAGCKGCTGQAVEVHHIKPIQTPEGWALRLDWDNLEAVCVHCHNRWHRR